MIRHTRVRSPGRRWKVTRVLWGLLVLFVPAAQALPARTLTTSQEVGATLLAATSEVMIVTPALRSKDVAEGLRKAAVERGVRVFLLADVRFLNDGGSYLNGLSLTPGIQVRLLRGVGASRATVDRQLTLSGPLLSDIASPLQQELTATTQEPFKVRSAAAWFSKAWAQARPYKYKVPDLAPKTPALSPTK
jgi:hypothetical protein